MLGLTILHSTDETVTVRVENQQQRQQQQEETEVLTGNLAHHHDGAAAVNDAAAPSAGVSATHTKRPCPCGGGDDDDDNRAILADTSRSANPPIPGEPSSASATIPLAGKKIRVAEEGRGNRSYPPPSWEEMLLRLAAYKEKNGVRRTTALSLDFCCVCALRRTHTWQTEAHRSSFSPFAILFQDTLVPKRFVDDPRLYVAYRAGIRSQ
jgi:hypothetical protein